MSQLVIGTAGHIDHGKTSLVEALTGTNTDSLDEEQSRGMTINLGFAYLDESVTIIDVPGHEKFVRNMVAGVSNIDVALLVVAADDGVMPQTREHIHILSHLGIPRCVVALTKSDRVNDTDWIALVSADIQELLKDTPFPNTPIIPTSTVTGEGIDDIRKALISKTESREAKKDSDIFRMPIDRVFHKKGFGVVVTGTVLSGTLEKGDSIEVLPETLKVKVRGMQTHLAETDKVNTGDRAAVNITGIEADQLWRGCELHSVGWMQSTQRIAVKVTMLPDTRWKLKDKQRIRLHIGTAEVLGRVSMYETKSIGKGNSNTVLVTLEKPVSAAMDDKVIVRSYSPMDTIAGGVVLDPHPPKGEIIRKWLNDLSEDSAGRLNQWVLFNQKNPKSVLEYARHFHVSEADILSISEKADLHIENGLLIHPDSESGHKESVLNFLTDFHRSNPYKKSVNADTIQSKLNLSSSVVNLVLADLISEGKAKEAASGFALIDHEVKLNEDDRKSADAISQWIKGQGFQLSKTNDIAATIKLEPKKALELLHILKDEGAVDMVGDSFWIHSDVSKSLQNELQAFFKQNDSLDVNTFKGMTGTSRKSAIPLLEFCDGRGWTDRSGNIRIKGHDI